MNGVILNISIRNLHKDFISISYHISLPGDTQSFTGLIRRLNLLLTNKKHVTQFLRFSQQHRIINNLPNKPYVLNTIQ